MKTIDVPREAKAVCEFLGQARDGGLVARDADGQAYVVVAIDEFDEEIIRTRGNKDLMALLDERRKSPGIPLAEARKQLGLSGN